MRVGSLFAGIGGFDLAAERAGMEVVWQSEIDPKASAVLAHHWPEVPNYGDIHNMGRPSGRGLQQSHLPSGRPGVPGGDSDVRSTDDGDPSPAIGGTNDRIALPGVDVLTGGFPCQDYSVAGQRGGLAGDRGALWWEYHRLITHLRPTWVVGENVPGLLSSRDGADFETIVGSLTECGYGVAWAVLDAQYFGVAQRRRRVFIVGHSGGVPRPEVLALSEGLFGHPEPRRETGKGVAALTANGLGGGGPDDNLAQAGHLLAFNWQSGGDVRFSVRDGYTDALHSGQVPAVADVSVRRLTPLECERLQGFPDGWTDIPGNADTQRYRQLGNAVAVPVVEWLLKRIGES